MSRWKIFYTDGTSLKWDHPQILEDVTQIPAAKRFGVHSVIQPMGLPPVQRETIPAYHYLYMIAEDKWMGVGTDGLLDHLVVSLDNISCILQGRIMVSDGFFALRKQIAQDTDIVGSIP